MEINTAAELERVLTAERPKYLELWVCSPEGRSLCTLMNDDIGWLMYLRESGDAGFHTINAEYSGSTDDVITYRLENGQVDEYPASWAIPAQQVERALRHFLEQGVPLRELNWSNDSGDGCVISDENPTGDRPEGVTEDHSALSRKPEYDDLTLYILHNYGHLWTKLEQQAHMKSMILLRGGPYGPEGVPLASLSEDPQVRELGAVGQEAIVRRAVQRILTEHKGEVILNHCPKCGKLCRTPRAKQCRSCLHDWH
jgi:hypothetical protein